MVTGFGLEPNGGRADSCAGGAAEPACLEPYDESWNDGWNCIGPELFPGYVPGLGGSDVPGPGGAVELAGAPLEVEPFAGLWGVPELVVGRD